MYIVEKNVKNITFERVGRLSNGGENYKLEIKNTGNFFKRKRKFNIFLH